jgi:hypothetical protein
MPVDASFNNQAQYYGQQMEAEDKGHHEKENLCYFNKFGELSVLLHIINQAEEEKQFQCLTHVKVQPQVPLLVGLHVN